MRACLSYDCPRRGQCQRYRVEWWSATDAYRPHPARCTDYLDLTAGECVPLDDLAECDHRALVSAQDIDDDTDRMEW